LLPTSDPTDSDNDGHSTDDNDDSACEPIAGKHKRKRLTEEQRISRDIKKHPLLPLEESCRLKCDTKFSNERCAKIHQQFWCLGFEKRRLWLRTTLRVKNKARKRVREGDKKHHDRDNTIIWQLPLNGDFEVVCKKHFLQTLGLKKTRTPLLDERSISKVKHEVLIV
jgi:hypothetical protein